MKHKFEAIGETGAAIIMAGLAASGYKVITTGFIGQLVFAFFKFCCMYLASLGLIVLNVGAEKLETILSEESFDGSWDAAEKLIQKIRDQGRDLTDEEVRQIDAPVIAAFRKFASFGRVRKR